MVWGHGKEARQELVPLRASDKGMARLITAYVARQAGMFVLA